MAAPICLRLQALIRNKCILCSRLSTSVSVGAGHRWREERGLTGNWTEPGNSITDSPDWSYADGRPGCLTHRQKLRVQKQMDYAKRIVELVKDVDFAVDYELKLKEQQEMNRQEVLGNKLRPKGVLLEGNSTPSKSRRRQK